MLLSLGKQDAGYLWKWQSGEEVRFDGSSDKGYEKLDYGLSELLDEIITEWEECGRQK